MQIAEGGYSFVFLVEEVLAGIPVEGAEFALKRVSCLLQHTIALYILMNISLSLLTLFAPPYLH